MAKSLVVIEWKDTATCSTASSSVPGSPEVVITLTPIFDAGRACIRGVIPYPGKDHTMQFAYPWNYSLRDAKIEAEKVYRSLL